MKETNKSNQDTLTIDIPEIMYNVTLDVLPDGTKVSDMTNKAKEAYIAKVKAEELARALDTEKELQSSYIRHRYESITTNRTEFEEKTFQMQYAEYVAYLSNKKSPVPYVSALAKARKVQVSVVMDGIGKAITNLAKTHGAIAKLQQDLWAASSLEELRKVVDDSVTIDANSV